MAMLMDELEAKVRAFLEESQSEESSSSVAEHTFAQRAESYYEKRPYLLSLLRHLHSAYLSLLLSSQRNPNPNMYHHHRKQEKEQQEVQLHAYGDDLITSSSSPRSTISCSYSSSSSDPDSLVMDALVVEMVMKTVECDFVSHELGMSRSRADASARRCELQGKLVEVLESERMVLSGENSRLWWRAAALAEEGEALGLEVAFLRRRVGELTRMRREEGRVAADLGRRVEELRRQILGLERWSRSPRVVVVREMKGKEKEGQGQGQGQGECECSCVCSNSNSNHISNSNSISISKSGVSVGVGVGGGRLGERVAKWWDKFKGFDFLLCGPYYSPPPASASASTSTATNNTDRFSSSASSSGGFLIN